MAKFEKNIKNLTMTPEMWGELNKCLSAEEYRKIVNDYQHREWERLPSCNSIFGLCRNFSCGKCTKNGKCSSKIK